MTADPWAEGSDPWSTAKVVLPSPPPEPDPWGATDLGFEFEGFRLDPSARSSLDQLTAVEQEALSRRIKRTIPNNPSSFVMCHVRSLKESRPAPARWERCTDDDDRRWWWNGIQQQFFYEDDPGLWCRCVDRNQQSFWKHETGSWFYEATGSQDAPLRETDDVRRWDALKGTWTKILPDIARLVEPHFDAPTESAEKRCQALSNAWKPQHLSFLVSSVQRVKGPNLGQQWRCFSARRIDDEPPARWLQFLCMALAVEPSRVAQLFPTTTWTKLQRDFLELAKQRAQDGGCSPSATLDLQELTETQLQEQTRELHDICDASGSDASSSASGATVCHAPSPEVTGCEARGPATGGEEALFNEADEKLARVLTLDREINSLEEQRARAVSDLKATVQLIRLARRGERQDVNQWDV